MRDVSLNKLETISYFGIWAASALYSLYRFYLTCDGKFNPYYDHYYFAPGSSWINRKLDISDDEWVTAISFLKLSIPWFIFQFISSQTLKYFQFSSRMISSVYLTISLLFIGNYSGVPGVVLLLGQILISYLLTLFNSRRVLFLVQFLLLMLMQTSHSQTVVYRWLFEDNDLVYKFTVAMFWTMLRTISSGIDIINDKSNRRNRKLDDFLHSAAYCLYLPTLFLGPLFLYSNFIKGVKEPFKKWTLKRITHSVLNLTRYIFWLIVNQIGMNFLYTNAMTYKPEQVKHLNSWAFYGFGYSMGQFFFNKYFVTYGITGEISRAEDIDAPPPPKCIGRIHLYSAMWKHFDRGLYEFLLRYIYSPLMKLDLPMKKLFASFVTFTFIYVWHGLHLYVFIWCFMNFAGIVLEQILQSVQNSQSFRSWEQKHLSLRNSRRFDCLLSVPLLAMSAVSNFYFFGGTKIGNLFFQKIFQESILTVSILFFVLYCTCQVSTEMTKVEKSKKTV